MEGINTCQGRGIETHRLDVGLQSFAFHATVLVGATPCVDDDEGPRPDVVRHPEHLEHANPVVRPVPPDVVHVARPTREQHRQRRGDGSWSVMGGRKEVALVPGV